MFNQWAAPCESAEANVAEVAETFGNSAKSESLGGFRYDKYRLDKALAGLHQFVP